MNPNYLRQFRAFNKAWAILTDWEYKENINSLWIVTFVEFCKNESSQDTDIDLEKCRGI
jgi:hypothetical protein